MPAKNAMDSLLELSLDDLIKKDRAEAKSKRKAQNKGTKKQNKGRGAEPLKRSKRGYVRKENDFEDTYDDWKRDHEWGGKNNRGGWYNQTYQHRGQYRRRREFGRDRIYYHRYNRHQRWDDSGYGQRGNRGRNRGNYNNRRRGRNNRSPSRGRDSNRADGGGEVAPWWARNGPKVKVGQSRRRSPAVGRGRNRMNSKQMWNPEWEAPSDRPDYRQYNRRGQYAPRNDRRGRRGPRGGDRREREEEGDGYSVLVHNMNYHIYPSDLSDLFRGIGGLIMTWVDYDAADRASGTGGALFKRKWQADRACEFDGIQVADVHMRVDLEECVPGRNASILKL